MRTLRQTSDCGWVEYLQGMGWQPALPLGALAQAAEQVIAREAWQADLNDSTAGDEDSFAQRSTCYHDGDAAQNGALGDRQES